MKEAAINQIITDVMTQIIFTRNYEKMFEAREPYFALSQVEMIRIGP